MKLADEYPVSLVCRTLGCSRGNYYYQAKGRDDQVLKEALEQVAGTWPTCGYRRLTAQLQREGWPVNGKRVRGVMGEMSLRGKVYRKKRRTTSSDHPFPRHPNLVQELKVVRPDQALVADITSMRHQGEFVYLGVVRDLFTRCIRGWHLGRSLSQELSLVALEQALAKQTQ